MRSQDGSGEQQFEFGTLPNSPRKRVNSRDGSIEKDTSANKGNRFRL